MVLKEWMNSVLETIRPIDGWLAEDEACLLLLTARHAATMPPATAAIVEVGSYCGKSTVVLGLALAGLPETHVAKLIAIDPHEGVISVQGAEVCQISPTLQSLRQNIENAGLSKTVRIIAQRSYEVELGRPISMLFIDGLHDYVNVARDFQHFAPSLVDHAYVAFHDYTTRFPGVRKFVDQLVQGGEFSIVNRASTLIVLKKGLSTTRQRQR